MEIAFRKFWFNNRQGVRGQYESKSFSPFICFSSDREREFGLILEKSVGYRQHHYSIISRTKYRERI